MLIFVPNPHVRLDRPWAAPYVPLELLSAMATAEELGASAALFDVNRLVEHGLLSVSPSIWEQAAALLAETAPAAVLLETWTGTLHNTLLLTSALRRSLPDVPLVLLGAGTSAMATEVLERFFAVDGVIRGEPEPAVAALAASADRSLPRAPGLVRRVAGVVEDSALAAVEDLDALPRAAYHLALLEPGDTIPVEPGRGCPQGCTFCALAGHWSPRHRPRGAPSLAREMRRLGRDYPGSVLDLTQDPVFFNHGPRLTELCALLQGAALRWTCHARVDRLSPDQLELLAGAGCCGVLMGLESGCPSMQRALGKEVELASVQPTVRAAAQLGLEVRTSFIVGFPQERLPSLTRTAVAMLEAQEAGAADAPVQLLRAYPGSPVHHQLAEVLELEPLLCTASEDDAAALALITAHPDLLSASCRVPGALPRGQVLAAWVCLSALREVLAALWRHGVDPGAVLGQLTLPPDTRSMLRAVEQVGQQLQRLVPRLTLEHEPVDAHALGDLIAYHVGLFAVGCEHLPDPPQPDDRALSLLLTQPSRVVPLALAPWRLLQVNTEVDRLAQGLLSECGHQQQQQVLLAKVPAAGQASFYTRRSFSLEVFELDELSAGVMALCSGGLDLLAVANTLAARWRRSPTAVLEDCVEVVSDLSQDGVLALAVKNRGSVETAVSEN